MTEVTGSQQIGLKGFARTQVWLTIVQIAESIVVGMEHKALKSDEPSKDVFKAQGARELLKLLQARVSKEST